MRVKFNDRGEELCDQEPVEVPVGFGRPETTDEMIMRMIRGELSRQAVQSGSESFEDANDFDIDDAEWDEVITNHELLDMVEEVPDESSETQRQEPVGADEKVAGRSKGKKASVVPGEAEGSVRDGDGSPGSSEE